jgi:hypothetical protein
MYYSMSNVKTLPDLMYIKQKLMQNLTEKFFISYIHSTYQQLKAAG